MSAIASTNRVHDFLSSLTLAERADLATRMAHDDKVGADTRQQVRAKQPWAVDELMLWDSICAALRNMHLTTINPGAMDSIVNNPRGIGRERFAQCSVAMHDYVTHACGIPLVRTHKRAVYVEVLTCLIKTMRGRYVISPKTVCDCIGGLAVAVEFCYPGYVGARMLHVIAPLANDEGRIRLL